MITFATLCSGIDAFGLAFERAGMQCVLQCEQDKDCLRVLAKHWPDVIRTEDVNDPRTAAELVRLRPRIVAFGSPCQDLSVAGQRDGLAGQRSGLFYDCVERCFECEAEWVVWENVPGVFSSNAGEDFASVIEAFTGYRPKVPAKGWRDTGVCVGPLYSVAWAVLDSQWFGVPQRRRRVFVVGSLGDRSGPYKVLSLADSVPWDTPPRRQSGQRIAASLTRGSGVSGNAPGRRREDDVNIVATLNSGGNKGGFRTEPGEHLIADTLRAKRPGEGGIAGDDTHLVANTLMAHEGLHDHLGQNYVTGTLQAHSKKHGHAMATQQAAESGHLIAHSLRGEGFDASEDGTGRGTPIVVAPLTAANHHADQAGRESQLVPVAYQCQGSNVGPMGTLRKGNGNETGGVPFVFQQNQRDELRTMEIAGSLAAEPGMKQQNYVYSSGVRRLTPRECERLQGFPDDFTRWDSAGKEISDSARYRMCGNSITVNVLEWMAGRLVEAIETQGRGRPKKS